MLKTWVGLGDTPSGTGEQGGYAGFVAKTSGTDTVAFSTAHSHACSNYIGVRIHEVLPVLASPAVSSLYEPNLLSPLSPFREAFPQLRKSLRPHSRALKRTIDLHHNPLHGGTANVFSVSF